MLTRTISSVLLAAVLICQSGCVEDEPSTVAINRDQGSDNGLDRTTGDSSKASSSHGKPTSTSPVNDADRFNYKAYSLVEADLLAKCTLVDKLQNIIQNDPSVSILEQFRSASTAQDAAVLQIAKLGWETVPDNSVQRSFAVEFHEKAFQRLDQLRSNTGGDQTITLIMIRNIMRQHKTRIDKIND